MRWSILLVLWIATVAFGAAGEADLQIVKQRIDRSLLPDGGRGAAVVQAARGHLRALRADGSWGDIDYADKSPAIWKPQAHLSRLVTLAKAYRAGGLEAGAKERILGALDYWTKLDPQCSNWWYNQIGSPMQMGDFLILMAKELSAEQIAAGVKILKRATWEKWTGQNLVWGTSVQIVRGCVENSPAVAAEAYERMYREIRVAPEGEEGIQADYSFHQHGALLYSGGYGAGFTADCAAFVERAAGTEFAIPVHKRRLLESYILDHQQWATIGGIFDYSVTGREITRPGKNARGLVGAVEKLARMEGERPKEFEAFARRLRGDREAATLLGNRHFWKSDYMVHRRADYVASVRMYSDRLLNTDGYINGENKKSHHLADGATLIYLNGLEYADIFPVWDWLRIPGTTCEQNTPLVPGKVNHKGATSFVGGVSDGTYGVAAMHLKSGQLTARKAWFFFDGEWVCLGSDISSASENPVYTSINQCLLRGAVVTSAGADALPGGSRTIEGVRYVHQDSIGYVFPVATTVHVANQAQAGAWSEIGVGSSERIEKEVFSLWLDHGPRAEKATYQYIVICNVDAKAIASRAADLPLKIVANTAAVQAVRHHKLGLLGAAFMRAGSVKAGAGWTVSVDQPCLLMMKQTAKSVAFSVSNPQNQPLVVNVEVDIELSDAGVAHPQAGQSRVRFELPGGGETGRSVSRVFGR
ncbi:MAG: polysaccharide lyase 8 family protein [Planctomycetota bacterium]|nr:polysaccharide lyase 8 family protein [Planctomycetota bacterium]